MLRTGPEVLALPVLHQSAASVQASKLPKAFDQAWTSIGGGQADLFFPRSFLGLWNVQVHTVAASQCLLCLQGADLVAEDACPCHMQATLMKVDTPLGPDFVPDLRVVERAKREDLQQTINYQAGLTSFVIVLLTVYAPQWINCSHPLQAVTCVQWGALQGPSGLLGVTQDAYELTQLIQQTAVYSVAGTMGRK